MKRPIIVCILVLSAFVGCGDGKKPGATRENSGPARHGDTNAGPPADHGEATDLGTLTVGEKTFGIVRFGDLVPGVEGAFQVRPIGQSAADVAKQNLYLWVESESGTQLSAAAKGSLDGEALHFHVTPRAGDEEPYRVVLRLRADGVDERAGLPMDGHGHEHHDGPHDGMLARFSGGVTSGHLELKLHDDKGDLELWLALDPAITQPFDLPLDAAVQIEFIDVEARRVTLRARNHDTNEDEEGNPNVRDGETNYFIFPGTSGEDATWLQGETFQSIVIARFTRGGESFASDEFVLKPHVH